MKCFSRNLLIPKPCWKRREEEAKIWAQRQEEVRQRERRQAAEERRRLETERKAKEGESHKAKEAEDAHSKAVVNERNEKKNDNRKSIAPEEVFKQGELYYNQKKYTEAVQWFRKAAEQGHADSQFQLGACYRDGDGVDRDYKEALRWFRKAADQGHARAQNAIGKRYLLGQGVSEDPTEAVKWFRKAAEQDLAYAQCNLGDCYKDGIGVVKNNKEAIRWYRKAAEQGDVYAQSELEDLEQLSLGMKFFGVISLLPCILAWGSSFVLGRSWSIGIFFMLFMAALVFFFQGFRVHMSEMDNSQRPIYIIQFILLLLSCGIVFLL